MSRRSDQRGAGDGVVFGLQPVRSLLDSPRAVARLVLARGRRQADLEALLRRAGQRGIEVQVTDPSQLDRLAAGGAHQGIVAMAAPLGYARRAEVLDGLEGVPLVAVLDRVQDPRNLGAILRTAAATGFHGIFVARRRAVGLTAVVEKAAAGHAGRVPVVREASLDDLLRHLESRGIWRVAVAAEGAAPWDGIDLTAPVALVLGGEGEGLRPLLRRRCDVVAGLPMAGGVDSLNVSVAFGAMAYEVVRQRSGPPGGG